MNSFIKGKYIIKGHMFDNYFECLDMSNNKVLLMEIIWEHFQAAIASIQLIKKFDHPNIIKIYEFFYMMEKREIQIDGSKIIQKIRVLYVIMEFQSHDLKQFTKKLNKDQVINIQKGLNSTLQYIHQQEKDVRVTVFIQNVFIDENLNAKCYPFLIQNVLDSKEKDSEYIDMIIYQIITGRPIRLQLQFTNFQNAVKIYDDIKNQINMLHTKNQLKYLPQQQKNQYIESPEQIKNINEEEQKSVNQIQKLQKMEQQQHQEENEADQITQIKKYKSRTSRNKSSKNLNIETKNLRSNSTKKRRQYNYNSGPWLKFERVKYYEFLKMEEKDYNKEKLLQNKFFQKMSAHIISRSAVQYKNYHNRVQAKTDNYKTILKNALKLIKKSE